MKNTIINGIKLGIGFTIGKVIINGAAYIAIESFDRYTKMKAEDGDPIWIMVRRMAGVNTEDTVIDKHVGFTY